MQSMRVYPPPEIYEYQGARPVPGRHRYTIVAWKVWVGYDSFICAFLGFYLEFPLYIFWYAEYAGLPPHTGMASEVWLRYDSLICAFLGFYSEFPL